MNQDIVEIKISGLPGIFPSADYVGKLSTFLRVIAIGTHSERIVTDKAFRTIYDPNYTERQVQNVTYNKYKIRILANEYLRADRIEHAKYAYVTTQDGVTHKMKILNVARRAEQNTELTYYELEYADVNPENYKNGTLPINNFLESEQLRTEYEDDQLEKISYNYDPTGSGTVAVFGWFTELLIEKDFLPVEEESEKVKGIERVTRSDLTSLVRARFYLTTEQKNWLASTISWADDITLTGKEGTWEAVERIIPEIEPVGINLWQIDIALKYQISNLYPENTLPS